MTHEYDYTTRKRSRDVSVKGINVISLSVALFLPPQCYQDNFQKLHNNNFLKVSAANELSVVVGVIGVNVMSCRAFLRMTHET